MIPEKSTEALSASNSTDLLGSLVLIAGKAAINEDARTVQFCRCVNYLIRQIRMISREAEDHGDAKAIKERLDDIVDPALKMILPNTLL